MKETDQSLNGGSVSQGLLTAKDERDRRRLARRVFLSALGLGLSLPLAYGSARLAVAQAAPRPRRLFMFYLPHGAPAEHFDPAGTDLDRGGTGVLGPLTPYQKYVTVLRGVGMNGAQNHAAIRTMLTGNPDGEGSDSIDALIAQKLGVTPYVLGAIPYAKGSGFTSDSFLTKHGSWVRPEEDPARAADALFQSLGAGSGVPNPDVEFRNAALSLTEKELGRLQAVTQGLSDEQSKLQIHLDAIRQLKAGGGAQQISCDKRPELPAVAALAGADVLDPAQLGKVLDAQLEVAAHALLCGTASVITLQNMYVNADLNMGFAGGPGVAKGHHEPVSHSWDAAGRAEFALVQRWFYSRLAEKLLATLDQMDPQDPEHTVLDNSLVAVMSEVSDGANHNSDATTHVWIDGKETETSLPLVLIGGAGGYLKPAGGVVKVSALHTDLLATFGEAMGAPLANMGSVAMKPIAEVKA
jgi:hypothetical protein